ncbi:hypothetical protein ACFW6F_21895 [Streptomyces sp. NPDC058746]|uniref:hypothetical protein n=1 Tax=Streptomyces sp. NPDC058746 TaxID=3346622 RepID=UPI0036CE42CE
MSGARVLRLVAVAPRCHLCPDEDQVLADQNLTVTFYTAPGTARQAALCEPCHSGRPSRGEPDIGPADLAWRAVERDVTTLLAAYEECRWLPQQGELEFAAGLARMAWTEESIRAAVRDAGDNVSGGKLVHVLESGSTYLVLRHVAADDPAQHSLRRLVDVLAAAAEQPTGGPPRDAA